MTSIRTLLGLGLLTTLGASCSAPDSAPAAAPSPTPPSATQAAVTKAAREFREHYNAPVDLDSTDFYYQPISVVAKDRALMSRTLGSGSSYDGGLEGSSDVEGTCYNVLFLSKRDSQEHLLLPHSRFVVATIDAGKQPAARWPYIFYSIIKADTNADGEQNREDAATLFASNRNGQQLRQLTPEGINLVSWTILPQTAILLVEVQPDSNQDREYTHADATYWLRFDLRNLAASPVRQPAKALRQQLHQQMLQRQSSLGQ